nr:hypothetical protein BaRGS_010718 [Batillaria attramentaria]
MPKLWAFACWRKGSNRCPILSEVQGKGNNSVLALERRAEDEVGIVRKTRYRPVFLAKVQAPGQVQLIGSQERFKFH